MAMNREAKAKISHMYFDKKKPWKKKSRSACGKFLKQCVIRAERQRARLDPECQPQYKRFEGYEL